MNYSLSPQAQEFLNSQVSLGLFASVDSVLEASILAFQQQSLMDQAALEYSIENKSQINALLEEGLKAANDGDTMSSDECFKRLRENLIAKHS